MTTFQNVSTIFKNEQNKIIFKIAVNLFLGIAIFGSLAVRIYHEMNGVQNVWDQVFSIMCAFYVGGWLITKAQKALNEENSFFKNYLFSSSSALVFYNSIHRLLEIVRPDMVNDTIFFMPIVFFIVYKTVKNK